MPSSLSSEGEFHVSLGWIPPISPCLFSHSASRYVKKKKKTTRPKFAEQRVPSSTKSELWEVRLGREEMGLAGKVSGITDCPESSEFINQVRPSLSGGELWVTVVSCFWCTCDPSESEHCTETGLHQCWRPDSEVTGVTYSNDVIERPQE